MTARQRRLNTTKRMQRLLRVEKCPRELAAMNARVRTWFKGLGSSASGWPSPSTARAWQAMGRAVRVPA